MKSVNDCDHEVPNLTEIHQLLFEIRCTHVQVGVQADVILPLRV
jgi:hypothetical protein